MSFDLKWFTTLPGIFITVGVLLLVIALIILIVSGRKSKKEKKAMEDNVSLQPDLNNVIRNSDVAVANEPMGTPIDTPQVAVAPAAMPIGQEMVQPAPMAPGVAPTAPAMPEMLQPAPMAPEVAPAAPAMPEMLQPAPMAPEVAPAAPAMPEMVQPTPMAPEVAPAVPTGEPVIYGGANPTVTDVNVNNNQTHQIYGGADPLENTQPIPAVQTVQAVQPVAPVPNTVVAAPEVTSVSQVQ